MICNIIFLNGFYFIDNIFFAKDNYKFITFFLLPKIFRILVNKKKRGPTQTILITDRIFLFIFDLI